MGNDDNIHWYPMRVTYGRELRVKAFLDEIAVENFLPVKQVITQRGGHRQFEKVPAVNNLIFLRSTQPDITLIKNEYGELEPLRYIMRHALDPNTPRLPLIVPNKDMDNFMRVAVHEDDSVMFVDPMELDGKAGQRVMITQGEFTGVEGIITRVRRNKRVVVQLCNLAAVAITFTPPVYLKLLDD